MWRGIESFICYLAVALGLGAIFAATDGGEWSVWSGITAGGDAWARIGSLVLMLAVFVAAAWLGGKSATSRRRHIKSRDRRKSRRRNASGA